MKYKPLSLYTFFGYLYKFAFLLILPLLQQLLFAKKSLKEIFEMWPSILVVLAVVFCAIFRYRSIKFVCDDTHFVLKKGPIFLSSVSIPNKNFHEISIKNSILMWFFRAARVEIDTFGRRLKKPDIRLVVGKKHLKSVISRIFNTENEIILHRSAPLKVALICASWANPVASLLLVVPLINSVGKIVGEEIKQRIYATVQFSEILVRHGIPPVAALLSYLLVVMFLIAFLAKFFELVNLRVGANRDCIMVRRGLVSTSEKIIRKSQIKAISVKQTLLMRLFRLHSAYIFTSGFTKGDVQKNLVIAATQRPEVIKGLEKILGEKVCEEKFFSPGKKALKNFLFPPVAAASLGIILMMVFFGGTWYSQASMLILFFLLIIEIWWGIFRFIAHRVSGVGFCGKHLIVRGFRGLTLYSVLVPCAKIPHIQVRQSPAQRRKNLCNLRIYAFPGTASFFESKYLPYKKVQNLVENVESLCR